MNNYMLLIASIIVCCSLIALLENETVSLVEPSWVKLSLPDTATTMPPTILSSFPATIPPPR